MRTWKQLICGLLGTTLCAGLLGAVPAAAAMTTENATEDDSGISVDTSGDAAYDVFTYRENDTGVTITSCHSSEPAGGDRRETGDRDRRCRLYELSVPDLADDSVSRDKNRGKCLFGLSHAVYSVFAGGTAETGKGYF